MLVLHYRNEAFPKSYYVNPWHWKGKGLQINIRSGLCYQNGGGLQGDRWKWGPKNEDKIPKVEELDESRENGNALRMLEITIIKLITTFISIYLYFLLKPLREMYPLDQAENSWVTQI